ncbi:MAG: acetolactate synthase [Saprospiraceae bacterium]|nr:acetolactate synthase [Bacteroidia bacterium]NNL93415.1 acetolactate synthase [Saprospiraceae bacterium]
MELTGGQAVVRSLIKSGVNQIYGLPGVQNDWLYNALYDYRDEIRVIHTRHEQGAGYMALGHYLATGEKAVYNIVPGPGFLNSCGALSTIWGLNAKVMCLVGQIPQKVQGKGYGVLHEIPDQMGILKSLTKWAKKVDSPASIPNIISQAFTQLDSGRPRPVGVEVSMDVLSGKEDVSFDGFSVDSIMPKVDEAAIDKAIELIKQAKNPLVFVAGGAMHASDEVRAFVEYIQSPVFAYRTGKGIVPSSHYLSYPVPAAHMLWKDCDLCISIGSHARMPLMKWGQDDSLKYLSINVDESAHDRMRKADVKITGDSKEVLTILNTQLKSSMNERPSKEKEMKAFAQAWNEQVTYLEPQKSYLDMIREELPADGILVDELTQVGFASRIVWNTELPRTYLCTGHMGTLGWGFQTALGAKAARPDATVISVAGDGGFMFGVQELATAVQHKLGVIVLLFNNNLFGNVRSMQERLYDNRVIATDLHNPDFVKMAHAFGANSTRVHSIEDLRKAIRDASGESLPTVIEIPVGNDWPSTNKFKALPKVK